MTAKIHPYQHPRYKGDVVSPSAEDILTNKDTIEQSDHNFTSSSSKFKIPVWPMVFWIGLGTLIFISLVIVVVVPIAALANIGDETTNTTTISTICPTTSITSTITSSSLPDQCDNYTSITDDTRSPDYTGASSCDTAIFTSSPIWVRFTGSSGTLLASCPIDIDHCGTDAPGWYSGIYPSLAGTVTSGYVCFNYYDNWCYLSLLILVTNCNGFYVYYLTQPPACNARFCTI